jgi:hypothetical protein
MMLVVQLPFDATDESEGALSMARRAPAYAVEWINGGRVAVATFPSLPEDIDLAVELVGEALRVPQARASVNATPLSSLTKLWQRLTCYRDSLGVADPARYCLEQTAHFHTLVGCEGRRCPVPCQFICAPCLALTQDTVGMIPELRYRAAAHAAEIDWCPHLKIQP